MKKANALWPLALALVVGLLAALPGTAGGARESGEAEVGHAEQDDHEEDHAHESEHHQNGLPHIQAISLGEGQKLRVVATTSIIGDVVSNLAGDAAELTVLIGMGQDPHSFEPTPQALVAVERAHIVFVNGFGLEEVLLDAIEETAQGHIVPVSAGIETLALEKEDEGGVHDHGSVDPHVWMDPTNVLVWVENIESVLAGADPRNHEGYETRAEQYATQLRRLDAWMRVRFAEIPTAERKLVTDHHLLGYFADEYGFRVIGAVLPATGTNAEPSAKQTAELVELLRRENTRSILVGTTAGRGVDSLGRAVAAEVGGDVQIVGMLTGSLAPKGRPGDTYLGYMEYNTDQIVKAVRR